MIHLCRSKDNKFFVALLGTNGKVLSVSETLNTKHSALTNIHSQAVNVDLFGNMVDILFQDDTLHIPEVKRMTIKTRDVYSHAKTFTGRHGFPPIVKKRKK